MNVVNAGKNFMVYGEEIKTYKTLPVGYYDVNFNKNQGFFLTERADLQIKEDKVYGNHEKRVDKILDAFQRMNRNLGVILSGQKGIGKSLFAKILANKAIEAGLPLINVSDYIPGIADFLSSIEQEVVVLFDEFEKTFASNDGHDPQEEMLPLFDGIDAGKKVYVITCNEVSKLNQFLLNRPGRFHYHFMLTTPNNDEIREYLNDKLLDKYKSNIEDIVTFAATASLTFDCLRAIVFELNRGYTLEETLEDLNIARNKDRIPYIATILYEDGTTAESDQDDIDIFNKGKRYLWFNYMERECVRMCFTPKDIQIDFLRNITYIDPTKVKLVYTFEDFSEDQLTEAEEEVIKNKKVVSITFVRMNKLDEYRYVL